MRAGGVLDGGGVTDLLEALDLRFEGKVGLLVGTVPFLVVSQPAGTAALALISPRTPLLQVDKLG